MDRLHAIRAFKEVAKHNGFAAAARALNTSPPSVSRLISDLEEDLGVRLFQRSTRSVGLTEEGEQFLLRGAVLIDELDAVTEEIRDRRNDPRGHLNISSVVAFGQERIAPLLPGFLRKYPDVTVNLEISNRKVDLVQEHVDLAIRIGGAEGLDNSTLKARRIYSQRLLFVATPTYVRSYGAPSDFGDLAEHCIVKQISGAWGRTNTFERAGRVVDFTLPDSFVVNSPNAARNAILTGQAMGLLADYLAERFISDGRLVRLLPDVQTLEQPIYAVFVHRNFMPAKVRTFIDHVVEGLTAKGGT